MSGVRANWHLAELEIADSDPDQAEDMGQPIDLSRDVAEINRDLIAALRKEARLSKYAGVSCDKKWDDMVTSGSHKPPCYSCELFTDDPMEKRSVVCATGRLQADLCDEMTAAYSVERTAEAAVAAVTEADDALDLVAAIEAEEAEELAAMALA